MHKWYVFSNTCKPQSEGEVVEHFGKAWFIMSVIPNLRDPEQDILSLSEICNTQKEMSETIKNIYKKGLAWLTIGHRPFDCTCISIFELFLSLWDSKPL